MDPSEFIRSFPARKLALVLAIGIVWGAIAYTIAGPWLGVSVWGGLALLPLIGLGVAFLFRDFGQYRPVLRIALSLVSLYLVTGLFALASGIADASRAIPGRNPVEVVLQDVFGLLWGLTFAGYLPLLWVLAYITHWVLVRDIRTRPGPASPPEPHPQGPTARP